MIRPAHAARRQHRRGRNAAVARRRSRAVLTALWMMAVGALVALLTVWSTGQGRPTDGVGNLPPASPGESTAASRLAEPAGPPPAEPFAGLGAGAGRAVELSVAGRTRSAVIHVPEKPAPPEGWPVVFAFHGLGGTAAGFRQASGLDSARAVVVYGEGLPAQGGTTGNSWQGGPYSPATATGEDFDYVHELLDRLSASLPVDRGRVFAAGFSNGGGFAAQLGCREPGLFSRVAAVSGAYYEATLADCAAAPVAFLDVHGTADDVVSYEGGTRHGARYLPVKQVIDERARINRCTGESGSEKVGPGVEHTAFFGCRAPVEHYRVDGGGHVWTGSAADADSPAADRMGTETVLDFFGVR